MCSYTRDLGVLFIFLVVVGRWIQWWKLQDQAHWSWCSFYGQCRVCGTLVTCLLYPAVVISPHMLVFPVPTPTGASSLFALWRLRGWMVWAPSLLLYVPVNCERFVISWMLLLIVNFFRQTCCVWSCRWGPGGCQSRWKSSCGWWRQTKASCCDC
jgi:hypothetical protein